jgi:hypothetical protein
MNRKHTLHLNALMTGRTLRRHQSFHQTLPSRLEVGVRTDFIMIAPVKMCKRDSKYRLEELVSVTFKASKARGRVLGY